MRLKLSDAQVILDAFRLISSGPRRKQQIPDFRLNPAEQQSLLDRIRRAKVNVFQPGEPVSRREYLARASKTEIEIAFSEEDVAEIIVALNTLLDDTSYYLVDVRAIVGEPKDLVTLIAHFRQSANGQ